MTVAAISMIEIITLISFVRGRGERGEHVKTGSASEVLSRLPPPLPPELPGSWGYQAGKEGLVFRQEVT